MFEVGDKVEYGTRKGRVAQVRVRDNYPIVVKWATGGERDSFTRDGRLLLSSKKPVLFLVERPTGFIAWLKNFFRGETYGEL